MTARKGLRDAAAVASGVDASQVPRRSDEVPRSRSIHLVIAVAAVTTQNVSAARSPLFWIAAARRSLLAMARSEVERRAEVDAWRSSGQTLAQFAARRGYSRSSLEKRARGAREAEARTPSKPQFVRLEVAGRDPELVVEVGRARIRVRQGFDRQLMSDVVSLLEGGAR